MEFFLRAIQFLVKIVYFIVYPLNHNCFTEERRQSIRPITNELLTLPVTELRNRLQFRKIKSRQLVKAYIDRITEVNLYVNALVEDCFDDALQIAKRVDYLIAEASRLGTLEALFHQYPIFGIPFTVKEACGVKGMSHVVGSLKRSKRRSKLSCMPVEHLRQAGGIVLMVSSNPEYCFSIESNNFTHGACLNPYDCRLTSGGSSGGEGALNACGATVFGIGSDIAGSIRIPCLFNGVFGHKPTGGLFSGCGHFPNSCDPNFLELLQMGPITRFSADLTLILHLMAGPDEFKLDLITPIDTRSIKIFYSFGFDGLNGFLHQSVSRDIKLCISKAIDYFKSLGLVVQKAKFKHMDNSLEIALTAIARLKNFPYLMRDDYTPPTVMENLRELFKSCFLTSKFTKEALIFELMRSTNAFMGASNMAKYEEETRILKKEVIELLGSDGVLIFPTFHTPAIPIGTSVLPLWGIDYCLIFNVLGLPCTHIPMGFDDSDLPIGFQVVAAPMRDKLCLHIANLLDQKFGGWGPPLHL